jgi:hypothetical protein
LPFLIRIAHVSSLQNTHVVVKLLMIAPLRLVDPLLHPTRSQSHYLCLFLLAKLVFLSRYTSDTPFSLVHLHVLIETCFVFDAKAVPRQ